MRSRPTRATPAAALAAGLLAGALLLGACGTEVAGTAAEPKSSASPSRSAAPADEPKARPVDLSFSAKTVDGKTFSGESLAGKPALLWFWAPWCPTCAAQSPQVKQLAQTYAGKVTVVGVSGLDDPEAMQGFVRQAGLDFPNLADVDGVVWQRFGVTAQSTFVVLDADGAVVADGYLDPADLERQVADLAG